MSSSRTGRISALALLVATLVLAACAAEEDDPDYHLGYGFVGPSRAGGGSSASPRDLDAGDPDAPLSEDPADPLRDHLTPGEVIYIDGAAGSQALRVINLDARSDEPLFPLVDATNAPINLRDGDYTLTPARDRLIFTPEGTTPQPLLLVEVGSAAPTTLLESSPALGVLRHPRATADHAVIFTAGTYDADGAPIQTRLYRLDLGGSGPVEIPLRAGTCEVVRDLAAHPTQPLRAFGVLDACRDILESGLVEIHLNTGAVIPLLNLIEPDPEAALGLPVASGDDRELLLVGRGAYDSNADLTADLFGAGVFRLLLASGEPVDVSDFDSPGSRVAGVASLPNGTLILDIDRGRRDLFAGDLSSTTRLTTHGAARSPLAVR